MIGTADSWMLYCYGTLYSNSSSQGSTNTEYRQGDTVGIVYSHGDHGSERYMCFYLNGKFLHKMMLPESGDLYAAAFLGGANTGVRLGPATHPYDEHLSA